MNLFSRPGRRDPARIDRIIDLLRQAWHLEPDWRLGQLISNLNRPGFAYDIFPIEDDRWQELLEQHINNSPNRPLTNPPNRGTGQ